MELLQQNTQRLKHVPVYTEQEMLFTIYKETTNEIGRHVSRELRREVLIDYVGFIDSLHKYQICCIECTIDLVRQADVTANLFVELDLVFGLVVVSADETGTIVKLHNFEYLQQEWLQIKQELLVDYNDEDFDRWPLITNMDAMMQDYDSVLAYLASADMYGLFFNGYWGDIASKDQHHKVCFGAESDNMIFEESRDYLVYELEEQQCVRICLTGTPLIESMDVITYTGSCEYIDGALHSCEKNIETGSTTIKYATRWIGLKKRLL